MKIFGPLYNRAITWSRHRYAPALLTGLSFVEGFIFPVPPEVMLGPMSLANRHQALWFTTLVYRLTLGTAGFPLPSATTIAFVRCPGVAYVLPWRCLDMARPARCLVVAWALPGRGHGPGRCLDVAWALPWRCLGVGMAWAPPGRCLGVGMARGAAWTWPGRCLGAAWAWPGRCLNVAWALPGRCLGVAWALPWRVLGADWHGLGAALARHGAALARHGMACALPWRGLRAGWLLGLRGLAAWAACGAWARMPGSPHARPCCLVMLHACPTPGLAWHPPLPKITHFWKKRFKSCPPPKK